MSKTSRGLILGSRGSALALWQANWARSELLGATPGLSVEILPIKTSGDRIQDIPLAEVGGKGLFTKELDEALLDGRIDFAVHSLKDLPAALPEGIVLTAVGRREDPRDALLSGGRRLGEMAPGARIGTGSLRRQAQLHRAFPDLEIAPVRGNVDTRLAKLDRGEFDGIILAAAGVKRLGHAARITEYIERDVMLPAIGQGALAIVCRAADENMKTQLEGLDDPPTHQAVLAERALMAELEGGCQAPIAGYAGIAGDRLVLTGLIASLDGKQIVSDSIRGSRADPLALGHELGRRLRAAGGDELLQEILRHGT